MYFAVAESTKQTKKALRVRHSDLHYLTPRGVKFLTANTDIESTAIRYPKKPKEYLSNDYLHRISTISIHISFDRRTQQQHALKSVFRVYYNQGKESSRRKFTCETRLELSDGCHYSPDVICGYQLHTTQYVFCLEVYNGTRISYACEQLEKLMRIIEKTRLVEQKTGIETVPRILCVCDNRLSIHRIQQRLREQPLFWVEEIEELLFFNIDAAVREDF